MWATRRDEAEKSHHRTQPPTTKTEACRSFSCPKQQHRLEVRRVVTASGGGRDNFPSLNHVQLVVDHAPAGHERVRTGRLEKGTESLATRSTDGGHRSRGRWILAEENWTLFFYLSFSFSLFCVLAFWLPGGGAATDPALGCFTFRDGKAGLKSAPPCLLVHTVG